MGLFKRSVKENKQTIIETDNNIKKSLKSQKRFFILGLIIEVFIITIFLYFKFFIAYDSLVICKKSTADVDTGMIRTTTNKLYIKNDKSYKLKSIFKYSFQWESSYVYFKNSYIQGSTYDIAGYSDIERFDDTNFVYERTQTYNYNKLKKDSNVKLENGVYTIYFDASNIFKISPLSKEEIIIQYTSLDYICEEK